MTPITNPTVAARIFARFQEAKKIGARNPATISRDDFKRGTLAALFISGTRYELHAHEPSGRVWFYEDTLRHEEFNPKLASWVARKARDVQAAGKLLPYD